MTIARAAGAASFPRDARILRKIDFDRVLRAPNRCGSALFRAQLAPGDAHAHARLGLAIAKRVVRKSHDRNRLKRHVRDVFRNQRAGLPDFDIVVFAKPDAAAATSAALRLDLIRLFERIGALNAIHAGGTMPSAATQQETSR